MQYSCQALCPQCSTVAKHLADTQTADVHLGAQSPSSASVVLVLQDIPDTTKYKLTGAVGLHTTLA
jgi:hypothetical protein